MGVSNVWNSSRKESYTYLSYFILNDVSYPLSWSLCGVDSNGFITPFCFNTRCKNKWIHVELKTFPLPKPPFMSVPNFGFCEGKNFIMKLDIKVTFGCTFMVVNIVTVGSFYGWPRRNQTIWFISLFVFNSSCLWWDWQKQRFTCHYLLFIKDLPCLFFVDFYVPIV